MLERGNKSVGSVDRGSKDNGALEGVNRLKILFGTQTGTAEKFAKQLQSKLTETYGASVKAEYADLETYAYSENLQKEEYVFFLVATYGDGDPTDSSIEFDEWLSGAAESGEQILEVVGCVLCWLHSSLSCCGCCSGFEMWGGQVRISLKLILLLPVHLKRKNNLGFYCGTRNWKNLLHWLGSGVGWHLLY